MPIYNIYCFHHRSTTRCIAQRAPTTSVPTRRILCVPRQGWHQPTISIMHSSIVDINDICSGRSTWPSTIGDHRMHSNYLQRMDSSVRTANVAIPTAARYAHRAPYSERI